MTAPAGTPPPIIGRLHQEAAKALAHADVRAKLAALGMDVIGNSPGEFAAAIKTEIPYGDLAGAVGAASALCSRERWRR